MKNRTFAKRFLLTSAIALCFSSVTTAQETDPAPSEPVAEDERTLQTVVVRGEFIPEPQRQTSQVASFVTSDDLIRTGDDNIAVALTRLSGLSVVDGKFAYVRGLGDRYSSALLNGSPLPSPEPLRRTVPLNLFPSNILNGAAVQKTYSANYPGEFGGGVIDLEAKGAPDEDFFKIKVGMGVNTETTLSDGLFVRGSDTDWTGYDDGLRDLPGPIDAVIRAGTPFTSDSALAETLGESLVNSPLSVIQGGELGPNSSASVEFGKVFEANNGLRFGITGVGSYSQGWETREAVRDRFVNSGDGDEFDTLQTTFEANVSALLTAALEYDEHEVQGTFFYVHSGEDQAEITNGTDFNAQGDGLILREQTGWYEKELIFGQLSGSHRLGDFTFDWRGALSQTGRDAPYERDFVRVVENGVPTIRTFSLPYTINFSDLVDENRGLGGELSYEGMYNDGLEYSVTGGYDYSFSQRESKNLEFAFIDRNPDPEVRTSRPDFAFSPDTIGPGSFEFFDGFEDPSRFNFYLAELEVNAGFLQGEMQFTHFLQATLGARYEEATQAVQLFNRFGVFDTPVIKENEYILPAATLTWNFADDVQLRVGYSETIARPQFRELARPIFRDPDTGRDFAGNPFLVDSEFSNYDARFEYYFGRDQFFTVAGFYKEIENPIEEVVSQPSFLNFRTGYINVPKATLFGGEVEYRTKFDMPDAIPFQWMKDRGWLFSINYTYTNTEIEAGAGDTIVDPNSGATRPASDFSVDGNELQGSPENILNLQFGWEGDRDRGTLLIGWVDERILQRGAISLPDIIEDPGVQVDFVFNKDYELFDRDLTLGIEARNLLNEAHEEFQNNPVLGRTEVNTYDRGMSISASLAYEF